MAVRRKRWTDATAPGVRRPNTVHARTISIDPARCAAAIAHGGSREGLSGAQPTVAAVRRRDRLAVIAVTIGAPGPLFVSIMHAALS
jgi:hypothetical protein